MKIVTLNIAVSLCLSMIGGITLRVRSQDNAPLSSLDLGKVLKGKRLCIVGNGSVQFLNENELVLLVGPDADCYRTVQALELITLRMDGHVLARKPWPSTFPFVVLSGGRFAVSGIGEFTVLDHAFQEVQIVSFPVAEGSSIFLQKEGSDSLLARLPHGGDFTYSGAPLVQTKQHETKQDDRLIYERETGEAIVARGDHLFVVPSNGKDLHLADLTWLHDCNKLCQTWSGGTNWAVSENGKRAVFTSAGTRFPVTDASGLFPFWRVLVIDLSTGKEIYRKEFGTKTSRRSAQLSPKGDLLLLSDGDELHFQPLN